MKVETHYRTLLEKDNVEKFNKLKEIQQNLFEDMINNISTKDNKEHLEFGAFIIDHVLLRSCLKTIFKNSVY